MSIKRRFAQTIQVNTPNGIQNAGTLVFPYPTGESQATAWDGVGHTLVDGNGNAYAAGFSVTFGANNVTLTNNSLGNIPAGTKLRMSLRKFAFMNADVLFDPNAALIDKIAVARVLGLPVVLGMSGVTVPCPVDTNEDVLATVVVPANCLGPNGLLRISTLWTYTNSANNKTLRVRYSGVAGAAALSTIASTTASVKCITNIQNRASLASQVSDSILLNSGGGASLGNTGAPNVDTTAATSISITAQKASGAESVALESYLVELFPG